MPIHLSSLDAVLALSHLFDTTSGELELLLMECVEADSDPVELLHNLADSQKHWAGMQLDAPGKIKNLDKFAEEIKAKSNQFRSKGIFWTAYGQPHYSERLSNGCSISPWPVLFYRGNPVLMNERPMIGIVGTRHPDTEALKAIRTLSSLAAAEGSIIISGNAVGIDSAAHSGAFAASGASVFVLPDDICRFKPRCDPIPAKNSDCWLALSPWLPGSPVHKGRFIERNTLLADLCDALIVGEAGAKSGAFYTAKSASKAGIPIFYLCDDDNKPFGSGESSLAGLGANPIAPDKKELMLLLQSIENNKKRSKSPQSKRRRSIFRQQGEIF